MHTKHRHPLLNMPVAVRPITLHSMPSDGAIKCAINQGFPVVSMRAIDTAKSR